MRRVSTPLWTSEEIVAATGGTLHGAGFQVSGITFDSREVGPGDPGEFRPQHGGPPRSERHGAGECEPLIVDGHVRLWHALRRQGRVARTCDQRTAETGRLCANGVPRMSGDHHALRRLHPEVGRDAGV